MGITDKLIKVLMIRGMVLSKAPLRAKGFHIRIQSDFFKTYDYVPGEYLRVYVGQQNEGYSIDRFRSYSIWKLDKNLGIIDLAVLTKSNGIGALWAESLETGDAVFFSKPKGKFTIDTSGDYYIFLGDTSALAHFYELNRQLDKEKKVFSLLYDKENIFFPDLDGQYKFNNRLIDCWVVDEILGYLKNIPRIKGGKGIVYIAGEALVCKKLHKYFKYQKKWKSNQIKTKPFWNQFKKGLE